MSKDASDQSVSDLPEGVSDWLVQLADERGVDEDELLGRLLAASENGDASDVEALSERIDDHIEELQSTLSALEGRVDDLDESVDDRIDDVRERVIQVKHEADAKADADHAHGDLAANVHDLRDEVEALETELDALDSRIDETADEALEETDALRDEVESLSSDLSEKLHVLAMSVVGMRDQVRELMAERERRTRTEELKRQANRNGVRAASCGSCGERVDIGLLSEPRCPHCNESFEELDPKEGFFGSNVLVAGNPPALEGEIGEESSELDDLIEE